MTCNFCEQQCCCHLNPPCAFCTSHVICEICEQTVCSELAIEVRCESDILYVTICPECEEVESC